MQSWLDGRTGKLVDFESGSNSNQLTTNRRVRNPRTDNQALFVLPERNDSLKTHLYNSEDFILTRNYWPTYCPLPTMLTTSADTTENRFC